MSTFSRRSFLKTTAAGAAATAVAVPAWAQTAEIRHFWWGNPERDRRTFGVIDVFNGKHADINMTGVFFHTAAFLPWNG
ncbi:MAG: twin-arginine translocation signal domain-containing protein, partial [Rhodobacteraceae bacterium]|nr:twin-arginine translocation signal domain-containing protein [Paracoccaceae bacterium]